jgi:hypothetical protein
VPVFASPVLRRRRRHHRWQCAWRTGLARRRVAHLRHAAALRRLAAAATIINKVRTTLSHQHNGMCTLWASVTLLHSYTGGYMHYP